MKQFELARCFTRKLVQMWVQLKELNLPQQLIEVADAGAKSCRCMVDECRQQTRKRQVFISAILT